MALWDRVTTAIALQRVEGKPRNVAPNERIELSIDEAPTIEQQVVRAARRARAPYRIPTIAEALSFPAIQRAVTLISNTTGSITMEGYRNGSRMPETPRLFARPDPYCTPRDFWRDSAYNMSTRGETVWWIASRGPDKLASALVVVPLPELRVEDNPSNRLRPIYTWGDKVSTRWTPATPDGQFVHVTYLKEPGALRGMGPLQLCGAAVSVAVESQLWAANFYADGGYPSIVIKAAGTLGEDPDTGEPEAEALRREFTSFDSNTPRVVDDGVESVDYHDPDESGAQMLQSRDYGNGEAARMFGLPGSLLDYGGSGSSITYQTVAEEWTKFVRGCLAVNYLEPMEQAMSDLVGRSVSGRFNRKPLLLADIKTRFEVHGIAIDKGIYAPETAAAEEGYAPGDVEYAPVPFAPPAAVPTSLPRVASIRCGGSRVRNGVSEPCGKLLAADWRGKCPRCKREYAQGGLTTEQPAANLRAN